jgi:hypothetical protein
MSLLRMQKQLHIFGESMFSIDQKQYHNQSWPECNILRVAKSVTLGGSNKEAIDHQE